MHIKSNLEYFKNKECSTNSIGAIDCDGTADNTGTNGGIIRLLEIGLGRNLLCFILQLHVNELALHHLIKMLDGKTTGPHG